MRILNIIIKEFKQNLRDWKANMLMVLFPMVLIMILGSALKAQFDNNIDLGEIKVLYTANSGQQLSESFRTYVGEIEKELGITFVETSDVNAGISSVKDVKYTCYILLGNDPEGIKLYKNDRYNFGANFVELMMKTFTQRYTAIAEVFKYNPQAAQKVLSDASEDFVKTVSVDKKRSPTSLDYYAVTMLTLIILYASLTGMSGIMTEQTQKTGNRMLCSPVRKHEILIGKIFGGTAVTIVQVAMVMLFSRFVMNAYWGKDILTVILIVLAEAVMAISLGTGVAYLMKNEGAATGILNTLIPIMVLFGGGYTPLEIMGEGIMRISVISPVKWVNDAIFRIIYGNDYSLVFTAIAVNLGIAAIFIAVSAFFSRREVA